MAFRNSVKAACLSFDNEPPASRVDETGDPATSWRTWEEETRALVAALPGKIQIDMSAQIDLSAPDGSVDMSAMPAPGLFAPEGGAPEGDAPPASEAPQTEEAFPASSWHARAEALRAMAVTLPSKTSGVMMSKIAKLYDQFAHEAGWVEPDTLATPGTLATPDPLAPPDAPPSNDFAPGPEPGELGREEEPQDVAPPDPELEELRPEEKPQARAAEPELDEFDVEEEPQVLALPEQELDDFDIEPEPRAKQLELNLVITPPADRRRAQPADDFDVEEEPQALAPATAQRVAFPRRSLPRRR